MNAAKNIAIVVFFSIFCLSGCIQTAPIPGYARVGDQVAVGLGGVHHNAQSNYLLSASDINAQLTDSAGHVFRLAPATIFKAFPDYLSLMTYNSVSTLGAPDPTIPFDGGWFVTFTIADADNTGVPIAIGPAKISVTSSKLTQTSSYGEGTYANQPIEIIAGTSTQGNFSQQFVYYARGGTNLVIAPADMTQLTAATVGGVVLQIDYTDESKLGGAVILPFAHHPYIHVSQRIQSNGNGTGTITAFVMNPHGFVTTANREVGQSSLEDLTIGLQWFTNNSVSVVKPTVSINTTNSYYIDLDGNVIGSVKPQIF